MGGCRRQRADFGFEWLVEGELWGRDELVSIGGLGDAFGFSDGGFWQGALRLVFVAVGCSENWLEWGWVWLGRRCYWDGPPAMPGVMLGERFGLLGRAGWMGRWWVCSLKNWSGFAGGGGAGGGAGGGFAVVLRWV